MTDSNATRLTQWHHIVASKDLARLDDLLADDIRFRSPLYWKPLEGKAMAIRILSTVIQVFQDFRYERELIQDQTWFLEFRARIGELDLKGIDLIQLNDAGKIQEFEVMIRPVNALQTLGQEMARRLVAE
jgi:hypothetical protein